MSQKKRRPTPAARTITIGAGLSIGLLALSGVATAHAVERSELRGTLTVSASVAGAGTLDGFVYDLTSPNCLIDVAPQATTDAAGEAIFAGLFVELPDGTPCLYDVTPAARAGYAVNTDGAALTGLTAGAISTVPPSAELTASTGVFHTPTRNPETGGNTLAIQCLEGENTSDMRAGRNPLTGQCTLTTSQKTGLFYSSPVTPQALVTGANELGRVTYVNRTIQRGFHNATLSITLDFTDPTTGAIVTLTPNYAIAIGQTNDLVLNPANCQYQGPGVPNAPFACADRVAISGGQDASFEFGGAEVDLQASLGLVGADGTCGAPSAEVFTAESDEATFCVIATLSEAYSVLGTDIAVANLFQSSPGGDGTSDDDDATDNGGTIDNGGLASIDRLPATGVGIDAAVGVAAIALIALGLSGALIARHRRA